VTRRLELEDILARITETEDGCWLYQGTDNGAGYKTIGSEYVHRKIYRLLVGPIPDGYQIDHLCRVRACCAPSHLEAVTPAENWRRAREVKTHCNNGHPLGPVVPGENRHCAPCHAMREAKRRERIRAGLRPPMTVRPEQHGTRTGYHYGCRCDDCRRAIREASQAWRDAHPTPPRPPVPISHGELAGYRRGCRCDDCRAANAKQHREYMAQRKNQAA